MHKSPMTPFSAKGRQIVTKKLLSLTELQIENAKIEKKRGKNRDKKPLELGFKPA